jgi:hypothetical protein
MVEWMGQNFDIFPGFQQSPCYANYAQFLPTMNIKGTVIHGMKS